MKPLSRENLQNNQDFELCGEFRKEICLNPDSINAEINSIATEDTSAKGQKHHLNHLSPVVDKLGCNPNDILFIDDSLSHVQAAEELGILTHHYRSLEEFERFSSEWLQQW